MKVTLPEGYVPPQPTHPGYGYLTPQERRELEAREQALIVPGVEPEPTVPDGLPPALVEQSPWAPVAAPTSSEVVAPAESRAEAAVVSPAAAPESPLAETTPEEALAAGVLEAPPAGLPEWAFTPAAVVPETVAEPEVVIEPAAAPGIPELTTEPDQPDRPDQADQPGQPQEPDEATRPRPTGWVPQAPRVPTPAAPSAPAAPSVLGSAGRLRWDAYRQAWVEASPPPAAAPASDPPEQEAPPPDVAAAAGGRGASSSWTSTDGQRFRWDARAQEWVVEPADPPEPA